MNQDVHAAVFVGGEPIAAPCDLEGCYYAKYLEALSTIERLSEPLPEGEVKELVRRLEEHYDFQCQGGPLKNCVEWVTLKSTIERQAASLATVERELADEVFVSRNVGQKWRDADKRAEAAEASLATAEDKAAHLSIDLADQFARANEAEASLASARRDALEEAAQEAERYEHARVLHGIQQSIAAGIRALSSPRQEDTQR